MNRIFYLGTEKAVARYEYRARGLTMPRRKRHSNRILCKLQKLSNELQSFQLGLLRFGHRCRILVVIAPRRIPRLANTQNPGAQTIPFKGEGL